MSKRISDYQEEVYQIIRISGKRQNGSGRACSTLKNYEFCGCLTDNV